jgi:hypothetical protein
VFRPDWSSSSVVFGVTRRLLLPRVLLKVGIALQPCPRSVSAAISYLTALGVVRGLVQSNPEYLSLRRWQNSFVPVYRANL